MEWILMMLAAWRLSSLLVNEDGPFDIFSRIRYLAGVRWIPIKQENGTISQMRVAETTFAKGVTCVWCVSMWMAPVVYIMSSWTPGIWFRDILAISSLVIILQESIEWLRMRR